MSFIVIIPVRFNSVRFPGKALADIHGKPMIVHVVNKALSSGAAKVIVATDSKSIAHVVESFEKSSNIIEVFLTKFNHRSGTERIVEAINYYKFSDDQIIVNVQGDEPLIASETIFYIANVLKKVSAKIVTLATPIFSLQEAKDFNVVKVVINSFNCALYFSRAMIPWFCENSNQEYFKNMLLPKNFSKIFLRHIGIYAYRVEFLRQYVLWKETFLEKFEMLEQLRILWYGKEIYISVIKNLSHISVDSPDDLIRVKILMKKNEN